MYKMIPFRWTSDILASTKLGIVATGAESEHQTSHYGKAKASGQNESNDAFLVYYKKV
jgi:hypothetical protein